MQSEERLAPVRGPYLCEKLYKTPPRAYIGHLAHFGDLCWRPMPDPAQICADPAQICAKQHTRCALLAVIVGLLEG
jgi:hypothetical protein